MTRRTLQLALIVLAGAGGASAQTVVQWTDSSTDASPRPTDPGADGTYPLAATLPELTQASLSGWQPFNAQADPFYGGIVPGNIAHFFRLTVSFRGVVNPPGPIGIGGQPFDPFRYGQSPVFGKVDIDVDADIDTGGVLYPGVRQTYLANVARYGQVAAGNLAPRTALEGSDVDQSFNSPPQVERSGTDFSLSLCGCWSPTIISKTGTDSIFDAGESWVLKGRFFERAHGYKDASGAQGDNAEFGYYEPNIRVKFAHSLSTNLTTVTLVFPLDMTGAAQLLGGSVQGMNFCYGVNCEPGQDHFSVAEALWDVITIVNNFSIPFPTSVLADKWEGRDPADYLDPTKWNLRAIVGTSYISPEDAYYVWTDTGFNEVHGDVNGDALANADDEQMLIDAVYALDGQADDDDHVINGIVVLEDPGNNFNIFDLDGDGEIQFLDRYTYGDPADLNDDSKVDLLDFISFQLYVHVGAPDADFNLDQKIDVKDFIAFQTAASK